MARILSVPRSLLGRVVLAGLVAAAFGCGKSAGEPCEITGSGFHASDPCRTKCLGRWTTTCPDGREAHLAVCAGAAGCTPGTCPTGQACYTYDDPFEERSYCVPVDACGPASAAELSRWETTAAERASATRARHAARTPARALTAPAAEP